MKIVVAADHGGFELKELVKRSLVEVGCEIVDVGCFSNDSVDYPDFAEKAVSLILNDECKMGILICGTGIGMSIAANRYKSIRAANCSNVFMARMSREHNNANVLCLGARCLDADIAVEMVRIWLDTPFLGGRHQRRIAKFSD
ncbi:MAG: ribose 5-phosphate isomerase B [Proteobacteria bacterium]|nr:ribose 5-phosphate isomerase B [Pseudomonadota bacterium]